MRSTTIRAMVSVLILLSANVGWAIEDEALNNKASDSTPAQDEQQQVGSRTPARAGEEQEVALKAEVDKARRSERIERGLSRRP